MSYKIILIRLLIAVFIGGILGYEREHEGSPAGFRTNILVCLGAAIISLISASDLQTAMELAKNSAYQGIIKVDMGRLGAQVVSGVGFLGAGTILRDKGSIRGLTTAATLWLDACLGLAVGQGLYSLAITGAIIVVVTLSLLKKADKFINKKRKNYLHKKYSEAQKKDFEIKEREPYLENHADK